MPSRGGGQHAVDLAELRDALVGQGELVEAVEVFPAGAPVEQFQLTLDQRLPHRVLGVGVMNMPLRVRFAGYVVVVFIASPGRLGILLLPSFEREGVPQERRCGARRMCAVLRCKKYMTEVGSRIGGVANRANCQIILTILALHYSAGPTTRQQGSAMRIKILCQNRRHSARHAQPAGGLRHQRGPRRSGRQQGNAVYLHCPNLMNLQLQALRPKIEALPGVFELRKVSLMPSERHSRAQCTTRRAGIPRPSIDMSGAIVAANRAAAQLLGVRVDEVPGMSLSRYAETSTCPNWCAPTRRGSTGCG